MPGDKAPARLLTPPRIVKALMPLQLSRRCRHAVPFNIVRRRHRQCFRRAQPPGDVRIRQVVAVADRQIEPLGGQRYQPVRHLKLYPHLRVGAQKAGDPRHQLLAGKRHRRRYPHRTAQRPGGIADAGETLFNLRERLAQFLYQPQPGIGQPDAAGCALHQRHPGQHFDLFDFLAHGRFTHVQPFRRTGKTALFGQHGKPVQMGPQGVNFWVFHHQLFIYINNEFKYSASSPAAAWLRWVIGSDAKTLPRAPENSINSLTGLCKCHYLSSKSSRAAARPN
ncbi:hypothetical protein D3C79_735960 [compost metagenome]